jgi:hypothetical protein
VWEGHCPPRVLIDPKWPEFVSPQDREYLEAFWDDLRRMALDGADNLWKLLTDLSLGPVATCQVGFNLDDYPELQELCGSLVEL